MKVFIDPARGGIESGRTSKYSKASEADINLYISLCLQEILRENGIKAVLSREIDKHLCLSDRACKAEKSDADIFVNISSNYSTIHEQNGVTIYYHHRYGNSERLARYVQKSICEKTKLKDNGIYRKNEGILKLIKIPAIEVYTGFISNQRDSAQLNSERFLHSYANAIAKGIIRYFKETCK